MSDHSTHFIFNLKTKNSENLPIYITGNFNHWQTKHPDFKLNKIDNDRYQFKLKKSEFHNPSIEYKYTRGGWDEVELDMNGSAVHNRICNVAINEINDAVPKWKHEGAIHNPKYLPIMVLENEHFFMPQLNTSRRVWVLLPHNYYQTEKRYPVLYLQDGQNLFDENAPFGTWGIDKRLAVLSENGLDNLIIVAVDHGDKSRINEYLPYRQPKLGKADGKKYIKFLKETLKPHIDSKYRTLPDRMNTGLGGSSMGGLISIYGGLMYPNIYGKLLIFSPSLWVSDHLFFDAIHFVNPLITKIYLYSGGLESPSMLPTVEKFKSALVKQGFNSSGVQFELSINPSGKHNEKEWGNEFPKAIKWLFY